MAGTIRWMLASAFLLGAVAPAEVHAGACARPEIPTRALTPAGAELAKGGGVVVAMENAARAPALAFVAGGKAVGAKKTVLGAGLVVYTPAAGAGPIALRNQGKDLVAVKRGAESKVVDAPKVGSVLYYASTGRRGTYVSVSVELVGKLPPGVVAIAIFDEKGALRSWGDTTSLGEVDPTAKLAVNVYASGSCVVQPEGFTASAVGDKIQVAYLDASGRLSGKTAATVTAAPAPKDPRPPTP